MGQMKFRQRRTGDWNGE